MAEINEKSKGKLRVIFLMWICNKGFCCWLPNSALLGGIRLTNHNSASRERYKTFATISILCGGGIKRLVLNICRLLLIPIHCAITLKTGCMLQSEVKQTAWFNTTAAPNHPWQCSIFKITLYPKTAKYKDSSREELLLGMILAWITPHL